MSTIFSLYKMLPTSIQKIIIMFYLSYGTPTSNAMKYIIFKIQTFKSIMKYHNPDDKTLWRCRINSRCTHSLKSTTSRLKMLDDKKTYSDYGIKGELIVALLTRPRTDDNGPGSMVEMILTSANIGINHAFNVKYHSLTNGKVYRTPTAQIIYEYYKRYKDVLDLVETQSLWRLRINMVGGLSDYKFHIKNFKLVCNKEVYDELSYVLPQYI